VFRFARVVEGSYRLTATQFPPGDKPPFSIGGDFNRTIRSTGVAGLKVVTPLPTGPTLVADATVVISDQPTTITVPLRQGARIRGRVVFDGAALPLTGDEIATIPVAVRPADGGGGVVSTATALANSFPMANIEPDGSFTTIGIPPGLYVIGLVPDTTGLGAWTLTSLKVGAQEMLGNAIRVESTDITNVVLTLTDRTATIAGTIADSQGRRAVDARVIMFPKNVTDRNQYFADPAPRRVMQMLVSESATFTLPVPPGEYFVAAVTKLPPDWMTPEYLQTLVPQAVPATAAVGWTARVTIVAK
jgi:hypothetical protein